MLNEGIIDRMVRITVGVVLLALVFVGPRSIWGLIGILPLVTGIIGSCPAYKICGIRTCSTRQAHQDGHS